MVNEKSIREAIAIIRTAYVDAIMAEKIASAIEDFIGSDIGKHRMMVDEVGMFFYELNSIMLSISHDLHLGFSRQSQSAPENSGLIRVTPHYVQIARLDNIDDAAVR